jgi:hydrogenase maturation protease
MTRILILGYGNPMRGDDGAGFQAAQELAETDASEQLEVLPCHQLTPDLAEAVGRCELVIFIDASVQDPPGQICCRRLTPLSAASRAFTHELTPEALLLWAKTLYGSSPGAFLISVGGESFEFGDGLSPAVAQSLPSLLACVRAQVAAPEGRPGEEHQH